MDMPWASAGKTPSLLSANKIVVGQTHARASPSLCTNCTLHKPAYSASESQVYESFQSAPCSNDANPPFFHALHSVRFSCHQALQVAISLQTEARLLSRSPQGEKNVRPGQSDDLVTFLRR